MKSKIIVITICIIAAILLIAGYSATAAKATPAATATLAPVKGSTDVSAQGHVVPRDKVYLSFASGGHVEKISVVKGDQVQAGQVLAELDSTALQQIAVDQAQRQLLELTSQASVAAAEQAVANARDAVHKAQDKGDSLTYPRASDTLIEKTRGQIELAKKQLARTSDTYKGLSHLENDDSRKASALVAMTSAQLYLNTLIANYNWYAGTPDDIDTAIIQSNLDASKANLQEAEWYVLAVKGEQVPANATGSRLAQLEQARENLATAQVMLRGTRLIAPFSGTITDINISLGQFVGPETQSVQLADLGQWYIETSDLTEVEVVNVHENQPVTVTLDSLPNVTLKGSVVSIAQNFAEKQGDIVYLVKVLLADQNPAIRWGMTATVVFGQK